MTNGPGYFTTSNNVGPDAMTWASTWEMMNRTLEAFATRNSDSSERGGGKSRKTFEKPKELKDDSDGCIDTWVEVMRLHLEQDNLIDERQVCTAILSKLEGMALKCVVAKVDNRSLPMVQPQNSYLKMKLIHLKLLESNLIPQLF